MPEKGNRTREVLCEMLQEILAPNDPDGHNPADVRDDQKECVLEVVVRGSEFVKSDLQRRRFRTFDVGPCFFDMLALQVGPQRRTRSEDPPPALTHVGQGDQVFIRIDFVPIPRNEREEFWRDVIDRCGGVLGGENRFGRVPIKTGL